MAKRLDQQDVHEEIKKKLLPVLERAAIGDYSKDIKLEKNDPMNIVYGGIQILINTIREQSAELQALARFNDQKASAPLKLQPTRLLSIRRRLKN